MTRYCMCNTKEGDKHPADCPWPLYRIGDTQATDTWIKSRAELRAQGKGEA